MIKEIEVKIKIDDYVGLEKQILSIGGEFLFSRKESNVFYSLKGMEDSGKALRVREEFYSDKNHKFSLTFKGKRKKSQFKIRNEYELCVDVKKIEKIDLFLKAIGYKEIFRFEKRRKTYSLLGCRVEIDSLPYVGNYIEIEGNSEILINSVLKKLNINTKDIVKNGYFTIMKDYAKKYLNSSKNICFQHSR